MDKENDSTERSSPHHDPTSRITHVTLISTLQRSLAPKLPTQISTSIAPAELVLSLAPELIAANIPQLNFSNPIDFKHSLKEWLVKGTTGTQNKLKAEQERYPRNFDIILRQKTRKSTPEINYTTT